jgi:thiosulfate/3-mercaptopyruvate sulfurtransferase
MKSSNLVSTEILFDHLNDPTWIIIDCRFNLKSPNEGKIDYLEKHIHGAQYVHLEKNLSGPILNGQLGRHPLPNLDECKQTFSSLGISSEKQVVAYDNSGGAIAARFWWILRWLGHNKAALLDGGWEHWTQENRPCSKGRESRPHANFNANPQKSWIVNEKQIDSSLIKKEFLLLDVRSRSRFRGEKEPIDNIAGHIPGAKNEPYQVNLDQNGFWKKNLYDQYLKRFPELNHKKCVIYCGSGVTACHTFFALHEAGFENLSLYPGSWSGWINDTSRPIALGKD